MGAGQMGGAALVDNQKTGKTGGLALESALDGGKSLEVEKGSWQQVGAGFWTDGIIA